MSQSATDYAQKTTEGGWRISDTRVSLDSIVHAYWNGKSPEAIAEEFPALTVEQVYGGIAFYLHNRREIDQYLSEQGTRWENLATTSSAVHGPLLDRLRGGRSRLQ